jgi:hypothetical protein
MEMSQENSLCTYLFFFFFFTKSKNRLAEQVLRWVGTSGCGGRWKCEGEWEERVSIAHIYVNGKMIPVETIPGLVGGRG